MPKKLMQKKIKIGIKETNNTQELENLYLKQKITNKGERHYYRPKIDNDKKKKKNIKETKTDIKKEKKRMIYLYIYAYIYTKINNLKNMYLYI